MLAMLWPHQCSLLHGRVGLALFWCGHQSIHHRQALAKPGPQLPHLCI